MLEDHHAIQQALADIRSRLVSSNSNNSNNSNSGARQSIGGVVEDDVEEGQGQSNKGADTSVEETLRKSRSWLAAANADHYDADMSHTLKVSSTAVAAATVQRLHVLLQEARAEAEDYCSDACAYRQAFEDMQEKNSCLQDSCRDLTDMLDESRLLVRDSESQRWFLLKEWRRHTIALCNKFCSHVLGVREKGAVLRVFHGWIFVTKAHRSLKSCTRAVQKSYRNSVKMRVVSAWMHSFMKRKVHASVRARTQLESDRRLQCLQQERFTGWTRDKLAQCHAFMLWRTLCIRVSSRVHEMQVKLHLGKRRRLQDCFRLWNWHVRGCDRIRLDAQHASRQRLHRSAVLGLREWSQLTVMIRTARDCSARAWRAVRGAEKSRALLAWNKWTQTGMKASAKSLHEAWQSWSAMVSKKHLVHAFITWMAARRNTALTKLMASNWRRRVAFSLRIRYRAQAFLRNTGAKRVRACFYTWARCVMSSHTRALQNLREGLERLDLLRWATRDWYRSVSARLKLQHCGAQLLLSRSLRYASYTAIHAWCQHVKKKIFLAKADERLIKSLRMQIFANVLHTWCLSLSSRAHSLALAKRMPAKVKYARQHFEHWRRITAVSCLVRSWSHRRQTRRTILRWVQGLQKAEKRRTAGAILGRLRWGLTAAICRLVLRRWLVHGIRAQQATCLSKLICWRMGTASVARVFRGWLLRVQVLTGVGTMVHGKRLGVLKACVSTWRSVIATRKVRHAIVAKLCAPRARNNEQGTPQTTSRSECYAYRADVAMARHGYDTSVRVAPSTCSDHVHAYSRVGAFQSLRTRNICKITVEAMRKHTARRLRYKRHTRVCEGQLRRIRCSILVLALSEWSSKSRAGNVCNKFDAGVPDHVITGKYGTIARAASSVIAGRVNIIENPIHTQELVNLENEQV
jgi:hypothetical protein